MRAFAIGRWFASLLALVAVFVLLGYLGPGCKNPLGVGYTTTLAFRKAGDITADALTDFCQAKREACKAKHKIKTPAYADCMKRCLKAFGVWRHTKRALNTSLRASKGALDVARERKMKKAPWLEALKPGGCQLPAVLRIWKDMMPKIVQSILAMLQVVEGLVCK